MEITYLGHSCFRLKNKQGVLITDPYGEETGPVLGKPSADIITVSHAHSDHNGVERVKQMGEAAPVVIKTPGEYEVKGISVFGIEAFHDKKQGAERGTNIIMVILMDGVSVCHLGDLGQESLTEEQLGRIGEVDVLLCPVGGHYTLDAKGAIGVLNQLEPKIFVPMHYKTPRHNEEIFGEIAPLEVFNNEYGIAPTPVKKLEVTKDKLPEETEIVVFE